MEIFAYTETIADDNKDQDSRGLYIDDEDIKQLLIARLMIGSGQIDHIYRGKYYNLNIDYSASFYTSTETDPIKKIISYCSDAITTEDLKEFYSDVRNRRTNHLFYDKLLVEISQFCTHQQEGNYTAAFVYIYRILELISFPFPLMYASQTSDFKHTYAYLKSFFDENNGSKKGELGFYKSFLSQTFKSNPIISDSVEFDLNSVPDSELQKRLFNKIKMVCSKGNVLHGNTRDHDRIAINFLEMSSFIIIIRNRFFHQFNRGDTNFEESEIYDSDHVFSMLNEKCFGFITVIYFEVLKTSWSKI